MNRIQRDEFFMGTAILLEQRSSCQRNQVGCVLVMDNRIISIGYNGPPAGLPHCEGPHCDISKSCERAIHAEVNAIYFSARKGIHLEGATCYSTVAPCRKCAEALIQAGITDVVYHRPYITKKNPKLESVEVRDGIELLEKAKLSVRRLPYELKIQIGKDFIGSQEASELL